MRLRRMTWISHWLKLKLDECVQDRGLSAFALIGGVTTVVTFEGRLHQEEKRTLP